MPSIDSQSIVREIENINRSRSTAKIVMDKHSLSQAAKRMKPYKSLPYYFKPALERVADYVREVVIPRTFEKEGPGWAPLSHMTMNLRKFYGFPADHPILQRTGDLFQELTEKSHPKHIEIIKVGRIARIEIGGSSEKFIENQMGGPRLPARPMIPGTDPMVPLLDEDKRKLRDTAMIELINRVERAGRWAT